VCLFDFLHDIAFLYFAFKCPYIPFKIWRKKKKSLQWYLHLQFAVLEAHGRRDAEEINVYSLKEIWSYKIDHYSLHFSPDFDEMRYTGSTSSSVERTWVSLKSVQWKPYFTYGPLRFLVPIPYISRQISTKFSTWRLYALLLSRHEFCSDQCSGKYIFLWSHKLILPYSLHFCPISTKFSTWHLFALVLSSRLEFC
jgi:hypothetical protein